MGVEKFIFSEPQNYERFAVSGYTITRKLGPNNAYSYFDLTKGGVKIKAVVDKETGLTVQVEAVDVPREHEQTARLMKDEIPAILESLTPREPGALEGNVTTDSDTFWTKSEADRNAEADRNERERNGDPVDD